MAEYATCPRCGRYLDVAYLAPENKDAPGGRSPMICAKEPLKGSCGRLAKHRATFTRMTGSGTTGTTGTTNPDPPGDGPE